MSATATVAVEAVRIWTVALDGAAVARNVMRPLQFGVTPEPRVKLCASSMFLASASICVIWLRMLPHDMSSSIENGTKPWTRVVRTVDATSDGELSEDCWPSD